MGTNARDGIAGQVVAVIRLDDLSQAAPLARALHAGGVVALEYTYTNRAAGAAIGAAREELGDEGIVGAGTVLDAETARAALLAGAQFIVTPTVSLGAIEVCRRYAVPMICGAFTPTEILTAWQAGADYVKVFPAGALGPGYIKDLLAPLPQLKLIPTGGVNEGNAADFVRAGAVGLGIGGDLVHRASIERGDWDAVTARARRFVEIAAAAGLRRESA